MGNFSIFELHLMLSRWVLTEDRNGVASFLSVVTNTPFLDDNHRSLNFYEHESWRCFHEEIYHRQDQICIDGQNGGPKVV